MESFIYIAQFDQIFQLKWESGCGKKLDVYDGEVMIRLIFTKPFNKSEQVVVLK